MRSPKRGDLNGTPVNVTSKREEFTGSQPTVLLGPSETLKILYFTFIFQIQLITDKDYYEVWRCERSAVCQPPREVEEGGSPELRVRLSEDENSKVERTD
jgi:hypothetical protein